MPIDISLHEDGKTILIRGYSHVTEADLQQMRQEYESLMENQNIVRAFVDASEIIALMDSETFSIFQVGAEYAKAGNSRNLRTAVVLPRDEQARADHKFMLTVEINRGRLNMKEFLTHEEAWAWLLSEED